jgi:hypothetical protein
MFSVKGSLGWMGPDHQDEALGRISYAWLAVEFHRKDDPSPPQGFVLVVRRSERKNESQPT